MSALTFGSLFAGIGGFDLGLERAGMECKWQVEIDPFCQQVLAKHWPDVSRYGDIRDVGKHNLEPVDLVCGGFPCQPFSASGKQLAEDDPRFLWPELARVLGELRPRYAFMENVSALLSIDGGGVFRGILGQLAEIGYDAEWHIIPASAFGAIHKRERLWIIAYANSVGRSQSLFGQMEIRQSIGLPSCAFWPWTATPPISRDYDGIPDRLDRAKTLGNAIVPQIAEWIGCRIVAANP